MPAGVSRVFLRQLDPLETPGLRDCKRIDYAFVIAVGFRRALVDFLSAGWFSPRWLIFSTSPHPATPR